jgi:DNA repair protein RecO (recombination protein O)
MYQQLKSLVLGARISNEADKLVTLYTREWGKITALVPGAKKIRARLGAATEPVTESELMVYLGSVRARPKVTGARILASYPRLRADWRRFALAQYCAEITRALTPFNAPNARKYALLARTWEHLGVAEHPWWIFAAFTFRFLRLSGYSFLEYVRSGEVRVPPAELQIIQKLSTLSGEAVDGLVITPDQEREILRYLDRYLMLYLPRPLAAKEFWQKIQAKKIPAPEQ